MSSWQPWIDSALAQYDVAVDEILPVRFVNNAVFRISPGKGGDFALRIHRPGYRAVEHITSELAYLEALAGADGVFVPTPLRAADERLAVLVDVDGGNYLASMISWLPGEPKRPGGGAGPKTVFRVGETLGRLHHFSSTLWPPASLELPSWNVDTMFAELDTLSREAQWLLGEVRDRVALVFKRLPDGPDSFGVIHNDFILLNCLHRGRRVSVIDFDDCGWGYYLQDMAGMLENLEDRRDLRSAFLDGYSSVRPLPSDSADDLDLMVLLRHCLGVMWAWARQREGAMASDRFEQIVDYRMARIRGFVGSESG